MLRILVIDDDVDYTDLMRIRLESWGHRLTVVHNWFAGMQRMEKDTFDVLLLDVETPTGNGLTATKDLCANPKIAATPKVFITGRSDSETLQRCSELNARYIHKATGIFDELRKILEELQPQSLQV